MTIQYEGGYFLINEPLVRGHGPNAHTAADLSDLSNYAVEAVNHIQETPWQVNPFVLDVILELKRAGEDVTNSEGEVILRISAPVNPRDDIGEIIMQNLPQERWQAMTPQERKALRQRRFERLKRYEKEIGEFRATQRLIHVAEEMSQFDKFYFPHNMDFRTRIYPIPSDLTPQSNDVSKGLLRFARGKALGRSGLFWLGAYVASLWGQDKLSSEDRFRYATDPKFFAFLESVADAPLDNIQWTDADEPFQFLGAAYEFVWAVRSDNPESFLSKTPIQLDGSCNGAQHLSIMARDLVGAEATNCRSIPSRKDLYMEVADRVWAKVERDAAEGNPVAIQWVPKMMEPSKRRKVVKRSVMTVPYGVTEYGVADFMIKDNHVDSASQHKWDEARYMRDLIMDSIDSTMANGRKLQRWFQACATICAKNGKPLVWDTPAGSKVTQAYRNVIEKRINTRGTKFVIYEEPRPDEHDEEFLRRIGMDEAKMGTAAPPNVVHSCDASHLQITVCRMADAGIRDFSMIHDSFGCHAADVSLMRDILRQSAVDMYEDNYLIRWKESVERYSGLTMPEPPTLGDFQIKEILTSEFFFA